VTFREKVRMMWDEFWWARKQPPLSWSRTLAYLWAQIKGMWL
jgi:hypothetical protein